MINKIKNDEKVFIINNLNIKNQTEIIVHNNEQI